MNKTIFFFMLCFGTLVFPAAESAANTEQKAKTAQIIKLTAKAQQLLSFRLPGLSEWLAANPREEF